MKTLVIKNAIRISFGLVISLLITKLEIKAQSARPSELGLDPKSIFQQSNHKLVDYHSGAVTFNVALDKTIPVSISYTTSGIRPQQESGPVGLGWNLQAGGEIRKIRRGLDDEVTNHQAGDQGRFKPNATIFNAILFSIVGNTPITFSGIDDFFTQTKNYDLAPDEYSYNVLGRSGKFYFSPSGTVISDNNIKVDLQYQTKYSPSSVNAVEIIRFVLTFDDGMKCYFDNANIYQLGNAIYNMYGWYAKGYVECAAIPNDYHEPYPQATQYTDSWKITKIVYPSDNIPLVFEYDKSQVVDAIRRGKDILYYYYVNGVARTGYHDNTAGEVLNGCQDAISKARLKAISKGRNRLEFVYKVDNSYPNTYRNFKTEWISEIRNIGLDGSVIKKYIFTHDRISPRRHLLTEIKITGGQGQVNQGKYKFEYDRTGMPDFEYLPGDLGDEYPWIIPAIQNTCGVDKFGYFNGIIPPYKSLISLPSTAPAAAFLQSPIQTQREPNSTVVQALTLTKITYPTGGSTEYTYEPNTYSYVSDKQAFATKIGGGIRVQQIRISDGVNPAKDVIKSFEYTSINNNALSSGVIENEPEFNYNYISPASSMRQGFSINMFSADSWVPTDIGYEQVIEKSADGSRTTYQYTTSKDYPYSEVMSNYSGQGSYVLQYKSYDSSNGWTYFGSDFRMIHRCQHPFNYLDGRFNYMRGLLSYRLDQNSTGSAVSSVSYEYTPNEIAVIPTILISSVDGHRGYYRLLPTTNQSSSNILDDDIIHDRLPYYMGMMSITNTIVGKPLLVKTTSRTYGPTSLYAFSEMKTENTYNMSTGYLSNTKTIDSQGREMVDEFKYTGDYSNSIANTNLNVLSQANILNKVVEQVRKVNGTIVSGKLNEYDINGQLLKSYSLNIDAPVREFPNNTIGDFKANIALYKQDYELVYSPVSKKLITEIKPGNLYKSFLWSYGQFNSAVLQGADMGEARNMQNIVTTSAVVQPNSPPSTVCSFSNSYQYNGEIQIHLNLAKADAAKPSSFIAIKVKNDGRVIYFDRFNSDARCSIQNDAVISLNLPIGFFEVTAEALPNPAMMVTNDRTGPIPISPINIDIQVTGTDVKGKAFYASFEEASLSSFTVGVGKTGIKSYNASYLLPLPSQSGDYKLTYWEAPYANNALAGNWIYKEEVISIPSTTFKLIGSYASVIDEVKLQPINTLMSTTTLDRTFQPLTESSAGNVILHYQYDDLGRTKLILNDKGDVVKEYDYNVKQ